MISGVGPMWDLKIGYILNPEEIRIFNNEKANLLQPTLAFMEVTEEETTHGTERLKLRDDQKINKLVNDLLYVNSNDLVQIRVGLKSMIL